MKFLRLRTFVAIADHGGVARAAARLNMTQSAASRQIGALETELGVLLFDRVGRRVQLTSEGEDLLRRSRRLLEDADSLGERARALKTGQTGVLRVGATPQVIENLLADFLTYYRRRHPYIRNARYGGNERTLAHAEGRVAGQRLVLHRGIQAEARSAGRLLPKASDK